MKLQKETKSAVAIAVVALFVIYAIWTFGYNLESDTDALFLYNRCYQMFDCFRHGLWPFLYYNDVGGIGYGSPIFYGQLTLLPFGVFLFDKLLFIKMYMLTVLLLNFSGFKFFAKRFTSYSTLSASLYILSIPYLYIFGRTGLHAGVLGLAFSWYFFAFCVDYFRDGNHLNLLILTYFLTWQSNFNSVFLATIGCFALFCYYFDIKKWRSYTKLFLCVLCVVLFDIVNIFVHLDALRSISTEQLFDKSGAYLLSWLPVGGFTFRGVVEWPDLGCGICSFGVFVLYIIYLIKLLKDGVRKRCVILFISLFCILVGYIAGLAGIWQFLYGYIGMSVQFPVRYIVLLFGVLIIIVSCYLKPSFMLYFVLLACIFDIVVSNPMVWPESETDAIVVYSSIVNAEFASNDFVYTKEAYETYGFSVNSSSGAEYTYSNEYNGLSVDCSSNSGSDILTLPKLYYKGYHAYAEDGTQFTVVSGYSNYCEVDIGSYTGSLRLIYEVPIYLLTLFWLQIASVAYILAKVLRRWCLSCIHKRKVE